MLDSGPLRPLLAFAALAFTVTVIEPDGTSWQTVGLAAIVALGLIAATAVTPWKRLPASFLILPALGTIIVIALLRQSQGGSSSGYGTLVMLPVVWVALVLGRKAVIVASLAATLLFALPIVLIGAPHYPDSGWRSTVLWLVVSASVGLVVEAVVAEQRAQAGTAEWHSHAVAQTLEALEGVASVARDISAGVDARERICAAALVSAEATLVTIGERRGDVFAITGGAGVSIDVQVTVQPAASLSAFFSQKRVFIPDARTHRGVSRVLIDATAVRSVLFEPIVRHGRSIGVLGVGWSTPRDRIDAKTDAVISYLAAEAGSAIERADLLARLDALARTDELTAVPNRRAWDQALAEAMTEPGPMCVAILDIDHFKSFNDRHGHLAGDRLLRAAATAWTRQLRPSDVLARYGGEEFAVLMRGCALSESAAVLERLRIATPGRVTCSLGVAERRAFDSPDELVARADAALYRAKREGRDRLQVA